MRMVPAMDSEVLLADLLVRVMLSREASATAAIAADSAMRKVPLPVLPVVRVLARAMLSREASVTAVMVADSAMSKHIVC
eukprot:CAMPEP_0114429002 /NCGR_PEP_ID=MMETSP0103-20121206/9241_1 /TAXON_ID=37642 ORGANISM="Paraphysomonas imperforata, Strain PA2" /NCGR_SAMPLE_ID=MMETSP0103 /ASSEMBLY_ACC=CAM_ASM_000201 /LENGTH=79 /DNA_ID=CAMNT_0001598285 /DNA_START=17 /DNA_END=256 /DNA_ORIENTATION=-